MQGVLKKGAKVARSIIILKNPITCIAGILLLFKSIFGYALFVSIDLGGENHFESSKSGKGSGGTAQVSGDVLRYEPLIREVCREKRRW